MLWRQNGVKAALWASTASTGPRSGSAARWRSGMATRARHTPAPWVSSPPDQVERRAISMAPGQHQPEAQDYGGALEARAQRPGGHTGLDDPDHQHEKHSDSVQLPPRGLHGVLLLP